MAGAWRYGIGGGKRDSEARSAGEAPMVERLGGTEEDEEVREEV